MIQEIKTYTCRTCGSPEIVKKRPQSSRPATILLQSLWRPPGAGIPARSKKKDQPTFHKASQERVSMRGLERIFRVSR